MFETLRPDSRDNVESKSSLVEIAGQAVRAEKKPRKRVSKRSASKKKSPRKRLK